MIFNIYSGSDIANDSKGIQAHQGVNPSQMPETFRKHAASLLQQSPAVVGLEFYRILADGTLDTRETWYIEMAA